MKNQTKPCYVPHILGDNLLILVEIGVSTFSLSLVERLIVLISNQSIKTTPG